MSGDEEIREYIAAWADRYQLSHDAVLERFVGLTSLDRGDIDELIEWKFVRDARRRARARQGLARETDERITDLSQRALGCPDELGALLLVCELGGVGP